VKLVALVMEEERHEEKTSVTLISLRNAIQSKVGEHAGGRICVETEVGGKKLQAMRTREWITRTW